MMNRLFFALAVLLALPAQADHESAEKILGQVKEYASRSYALQPAQKVRELPASPTKDTHRLKELEGLLESLPAVIAKHDAALADPDLYSRDPKAFDRAMTGAAQAREQLEAAELEWLELEEKKASLGA